MKSILSAIPVMLGLAASGIAFAQAPQINPCLIDSLLLNTGWSHAAGSVESAGDNSSFWTLVAAPGTAGAVPRPAVVVPPYPGWGSMSSSAWVSGDTRQSYGHVGSFEYQACFCLAEYPGTVRFSADVMADNTCQIIVNGNATPIASLTSVKSFISPPKHVDVDITAMVHPGRNCIVVRVNNIGGPTGFNLQGVVSAGNPRSLTRPACCGTTGTICGTIFQDDNQNSVHDPNEPPMPGVPVSATNASGIVVGVVPSGANGSYCLADLVPGVYVIAELVDTNVVHTFPMPAPSTYTVTIVEGLRVEHKDFGNYIDRENSSVPTENDPMVGSASLSVLPNPVGAWTTIAIHVDLLIPSATVVVCDATGRELLRLMQGQRLVPGDHQIPISTRDLPSGTFYVILRSERGSRTQALKVVH